MTLGITIAGFIVRLQMTLPKKCNMLLTLQRLYLGQFCFKPSKHHIFLKLETLSSATIPSLFAYEAYREI